MQKAEKCSEYKEIATKRANAKAVGNSLEVDNRTGRNVVIIKLVSSLRNAFSGEIPLALALSNLRGRKNRLIFQQVANKYHRRLFTVAL